MALLQRRYVGRDHFKEIFAATDTNKFVVSLGDLGESKDCTGSGSLFAGTTECFKLARALGFGLRRAFGLGEGCAVRTACTVAVAHRATGGAARPRS